MARLEAEFGNEFIGKLKKTRRCGLIEERHRRIPPTALASDQREPVNLAKVQVVIAARL